MSNYEFIKNSDNNGNSLYKFRGLTVMNGDIVRLTYEIHVSKNGTKKACVMYVNGNYRAGFALN